MSLEAEDGGQRAEPTVIDEFHDPEKHRDDPEIAAKITERAQLKEKIEGLINELEAEN